jgi:L-2-hydroxyglutarate oxidase
MTKKSVLVIGAGIIGITTALELAKRGEKGITVVDKNGLAEHASTRNSGVIHSGFNLIPNTLKARFCVEGSRLLREYCQAREVPMEQCGTLVIAKTPEEESKLEALLIQGNSNGVPNLKILTGEQLREKEFYAKGTAALFSPTGAIVNSRKLCLSLAEDAKNLGVEFRFETEVNGIMRGKVYTSSGEIRASHILNCAGLHADKIAHMTGVGGNYRVVPFRGEYFRVPVPVKSMIYPIPDQRFSFLGVHLTRHIGENTEVIAGPTATLSFGRESYKKEINIAETLGMMSHLPFYKMFLKSGFIGKAAENIQLSFSKRAFCNAIESLVDYKLSPEQLESRPAGIRAQIVDNTGKLVNDFVVESGPRSTHVINAVSPGMTSSLAFAKYLVDEYIFRR